MEHLTELQVAFAGVVASTVLASTGLFLNYIAIRKSNRIAVSSKLAELCKLLSDEMKALTDLRLIFRQQLEKVELPKDQAKAESLTENIARFEERQQTISKQIEAIRDCFDNLDSVDPTEVDSMICKSYFEKGLHEHGVEYARRLRGEL